MSSEGVSALGSKEKAIFGGSVAIALLLGIVIGMFIAPRRQSKTDQILEALASASSTTSPTGTDSTPKLEIGGTVEHEGVVVSLERVEDKAVKGRDSSGEISLDNHMLLVFRIQNRTEGFILRKRGPYVLEVNDNFSNKAEWFNGLLQSEMEDKDEEIRPGETDEVFTAIKKTVPNASSFALKVMIGSGKKSFKVNVAFPTSSVVKP